MKKLSFTQIPSLALFNSDKNTVHSSNSIVMNQNTNSSCCSHNIMLNYKISRNHCSASLDARNVTQLSFNWLSSLQRILLCTYVVTLYRLFNEGKTEECKTYFENLYKFVYVLGTYLKPQVAIMNGIVMGGGAGISLPGMFRVVTEKMVFSSPEAQIGFHTDAGASYYLSRLPGYLGEYLALTGGELDGTEMMACGLATHYSLKEKLPRIEERLGIFPLATVTICKHHENEVSLDDNESGTDVELL